MLRYLQSSTRAITFDSGPCSSLKRNALPSREKNGMCEFRKQKQEDDFPTAFMTSVFPPTPVASAQPSAASNRSVANWLRGIKHQAQKYAEVSATDVSETPLIMVAPGLRRVV